ncbi:MYND-type domain-containing protein [Favolaschia claudopus]|uniref:phytol kinase n=1 Tax=Favolaschia claudopus TaxID=2862362 RepID=A0AAW0CR12_9AGAR
MGSIVGSRSLCSSLFFHARQHFPSSDPDYDRYTTIMNSGSHGADCGCEDADVRLTKMTLESLAVSKDNLKPLEMTPDEINDKSTFFLQYLKEADIPPREKGCCIHFMGVLHAHFALSGLANISYLVRPQPDSQFVISLIDAWPGISKWLEYCYIHWIRAPMFLDRDNMHRCIAYQTVIISLRSFAGKTVFIMLGSCWLYEIEEEFKSAAQYDPLLTAAEPLLDLATYKPGPPPDYFYGSIMPPSQDAGKAGRVALDHLDWYLTNATPWSPPAIFNLDYHVRLATKMSLAEPYLIALTALHSVRTVTRILVALTAGPFDEATAPGVGLAIGSCLEYLENTLPALDGFAWTTHAVQVGFLPAALRALPWLDEMPTDEAQAAQTTLTKLLRLLSLYSLYPSMLRHLARSVRRVKELSLPETLEDKAPVLAAYSELEALVLDRSQQQFDVDLEVRCHNPTCRKIDEQNNFSSCSRCFTVSYCSSECQHVHWDGGHKPECKALKELRREGKAPPMSAEDYDFATKLVIEEVGRRKAEIVRIWREDKPERTPALSLNYFLDDPKGVLVVGSPSKYPPQGYSESAQVRELWENVISQDIHREHAIVGAYLPNGMAGKLHFLWFGIDGRVQDDASLSVVEKLIRTVELMGE